MKYMLKSPLYELVNKVNIVSKNKKVEWTIAETQSPHMCGYRP